MHRHSISIVLTLFVAASTAHAQLVLNDHDGLPDLGRGSAAWADFNNDGLLDVVTTGINNTGVKEAGLYFNNGDGTFSNSGNGLIPVADGDVAVHDINQDGFVDLLVTGIDASNNKIARLYKNTGSGVFTALVLPLEGVAHGGVALSDLNNDGRPDVVLNGINNQHQRVTRYYRNNGDETFTLQNTSLPGTGYGDILVVDFNNDSFLDVFISGLDANNQRITNLYENRGHDSFIKKETVLPGLRSGGMTSSDINNDGYADILISGNVSGLENRTEVYINNAGTGFVLLKALPAVVDGGGAWGDFNHDGFADLTAFGFDNTQLYTAVFQNINGNDLVDSGIPLPGASKGGSSWMDYNNDDRLDLFLSGYSNIPFSSLYTNTEPGTNTLPSTPANLGFKASGDSIILSWDAATDQETASAGLTYDVYIGTSSGAINVKAPLADIATGRRKVAGRGEIQHTSMVIQGLPEGIYYWAVQAIDPSFGASPFSVASTFTSCSPVGITGPDKVCFNSEISLEAGKPEDVVHWYSLVDQDLIGSGNHLEYGLTANDTIVVTVTKPLGCTVSDSLIVDVLPLPQVEAGNDQMNCLHDQVVLQAVTGASIISWFEEGNEDDILATTDKLSVEIKQAVTLVAKVEDLHRCVNTDTVKIDLHPQPVIHLGEDKIVCTGTELRLSAGAGVDSVNWFSTARGLLLQNNFTLVMEIAQADQIWGEIYNAEKCVSYDTLNVDVMPLPVAEAGDDKMICEGEAVRIGTPVLDQDGLTFRWEPAASLSRDDIPDPVASPRVDTKYLLLVKDENNCMRKDSVWVYPNKPSTINAGRDTTVCAGDNVRLGGKPTASGSMMPYAFTWYPAKGIDDTKSPNPVVSPDETTTYYLRTSTGDCMLGVSSVTIAVNPLPEVKASEDVIVGAEAHTTLSVEGALSYQWFPAELFADNGVAQPVVFPNRTTNYWVRGTDANGCTATDTVKVTVRSELYVPSLFTPNNDGHNDIFRVHGFGIGEIKLKVFDRWGRLLFESNSLEQGWDGRVNGLEAEQGNFVWTVEGTYHDGTRIMYQGQQRGVFRLLR